LYKIIFILSITPLLLFTFFNSDLSEIGTIYTATIPAGTDGNLDTSISVPAGTYIAIANTGRTDVSQNPVHPYLGIRDVTSSSFAVSWWSTGYTCNLTGIINMPSAGIIRFEYGGDDHITTVTTGTFTVMRIK